MPTLIYTASRKPVQVGDTVTDFRNETDIVRSIEEPRSPASTGRIYTANGHGVYPSVYGCEWTGRTDQ